MYAFELKTVKTLGTCAMAFMQARWFARAETAVRSKLKNATTPQNNRQNKRHKITGRTNATE
jgi:hypothetical protein